MLRRDHPRPCARRGRYRSDCRVARGLADLEADPSADPLHSRVCGEDVRADAVELFVTPDLDEPAKQLGAQPLALRLVGDKHGELRFIDTMETVRGAKTASSGRGI